MKKLWRQYLSLLDKDLNAKVFDNVKNLLVCALLFAAGTSALRGEFPVFLGLLGAWVTGWALIVISAVLLLLNISDGLHRVAKLRYHRVLQVFLSVFYLVLALRVVEIVWNFRAE
ncbi:hypothetical protein [Pseudomonas sp. R5(2019)]|uniref:hypothetical protein n=1 Tax=Pseudomonas sp. R5(2019) TaxID=2697566 RepID=UPI0014133198|nr:hypothetical protein [Pseudomonas sp. R5(2019)]NBA97528.1 hypothetical protein [Pseudomonas sp. R5(2019)]